MLPNAIEKLVLSNTNFHYADKTPWNDRIKFVNEKGLGELVAPNMERWFTKDFRTRAPNAIARMKEIFLTTDPAGYIACCEAIRDMNFSASNSAHRPRRLWSSWESMIPPPHPQPAKLFKVRSKAPNS